MKRLEWYVQIFVNRLFKGGKLQHVPRGISIEKQIQKRDATFANTISKFGSISFPVEGVKEFQEATILGPHQMAKMSSIKRLYSLRFWEYKSISYRKIV